MEDCIFCKIIKGEIPCYKIYEDEKTFAFLDISGDFLGHTLVIPKKHCKNIFDSDSETIFAVMQTVKKISQHYLKCGFEGINIFNNNNECAEQSIAHFHVHIIPRKQNDGIHLFLEDKKNNFDLITLQKQLELKENNK